MLVTVLTPAYNRCNELSALYRSLEEQTCKNFEWLIVDDGSTDDTQAFVEKLKARADFAIKYIYKANGGKHTAVNAGVGQIETELTFIVDSDDILTPDAIETILSYHKKYGLDEKLCGYAFLRQFTDGKVNGKLFEPDEKIGTYIACRINADDTMADKAEVFYTRCLREYPFPEFAGEHFLGEDIVWIRMALKYSMVHINHAIYVGDFADSGLTKNRRRYNINSPLGCVARAKEFMRPQLRLRYRIKGAVQYVVYGCFAGKTISGLMAETPYRLLTACCILPGVAIYHKWLKEYC